jgi:tetratricopeptide (TPR) repeat protein
VSGPDHPDTLLARHNLANAYLAAGRTAEAVALHKSTLALRRAKLGDNHPATLASRNGLASAFEACGRWGDAEALRRRAVAGRRKAVKPDRRALAEDLAGLGRILLLRSNWAEAEPVLRECLATREEIMPGEWGRFGAMSLLGGVLVGRGDYAGAEPLVVDGYLGMKSREAKLPANIRYHLSEAGDRVVRLYEAWGRPGQAAAWEAKLGLADLPGDVFAGP